ncbi:unnamed protein product [Schistocephalus solidus]|uniref:Reverse transcriptase domain-containing protein n=1 Tax=Schistocephalus solidus TaxID=70667 RepID=A0A183TI30_SCHSO|nr:unnamed protein product [Schistocephalus solidus]
MQNFGCPERFTRMVRQLHDDMIARVTDNGAVSEALAVTNGVKQDCVLALKLFSIMFSAMIMNAYRDERPGLRIAYRVDGRLFNQRWMHFNSRVSTATVHELLFPDDSALDATIEGGMQRSMDLFAAQGLREMQDACTARKAVESQRYADRDKWKNFVASIEAASGPTAKGTVPLRRADRSILLPEKKQILKRWTEHF